MSGVADRLGTGTSFGSVPRGRSARGRAKAVTQGDVPAYELVRIHLDEVSPTPLNPRRNFGTDVERTRFGEELRGAQLAACVAVSRDAYLALWPDHEDRVGTAGYILVNGERRYRSALHVGLDALDFVVRDDLASTREEFVNHLLKENLEREDFDVIERARGVQQMVDVCGEESSTGARARAAKRLNKDRSWVTNQLALLSLPDELQAALSTGDMPERDGRLVARHAKDHPELDAAALIAYLKDTRAQEAQERAEGKAILEAAKRDGSRGNSKGVLSVDNTSHGTAPASPSDAFEPDAPIPARGSQAKGPLLSADNKSREAPPAGVKAGASAPLGEAPSEGPLLSADNTTVSPSPSDNPLDELPWAKPLWVDRQVRKHMSPENRETLIWLLQAEAD